MSNNNNNNTQSGERLSFYKLFCEKRYRISIPIIQRDYAQGRQTTTEVRNVFLDALYDYLEENKANRDLDFVYGSLNEVEGGIDFIPLDGQQRLTTLFLLHWYLYQISENQEKKAEFLSFLLKEGKSRFTYETRSSSSEFCDALMSHNIDFNNLLEGDEDKSNENSLSKTITNSDWFFLSWKYDPTIQSMLTMLDAIHNKFADKKTYFERLINNENPIITFLFLNLKDFKLTDDLYIKMNSRGKPLTPFENFKAKFEQHIENISHKGSVFNLAHKNDVSLKEYFSHKIDTDWANLFWNYRELIGDKNTYDEEIKNFIRVIFTNQYAISNEKDDNFEFLLGTQVARKRKDYNDDISYYKYKEFNIIFDKEDNFKMSQRIDKETNESEKNILEEAKKNLVFFSTNCIFYLIDAFDNLVNGNNKIVTYLTNDYKFYFDENAAFENALRYTFQNNQERILFHAYIRFLVENKQDRTGIEQWVRVIHNLANNTIIDGADEIVRAIKSIEKLLPQSNAILKHLTQNPQIDFFSSWQVLEEKMKAHLILKGNHWKTKIENTEKHKCFEGQIGFILEFAGIVDYYEKSHNCNWTELEDKEFFNSFESYANKAIVVFENKSTYNSNYAWERAVLTKGDYLIDASSCRKNLLITDRNTRDYSWKRLLRITNEQKKKRLLVKQVFNHELFDISNLKKSLENICKHKTNTWCDYFIDCPDLMRYCSQGFIRYINKHDIILLGQSQRNHWHAEMYTYYLWKKYIEPNKNAYPCFKNIQYYYVKSHEDNACIVFNDFCYNRVYYEVNIFYCNNDELPSPYEIKFAKSKGENSPDKYGNEIKNILARLSFEWNETYKGYFLTSQTSNVLLETLGNLNKEIQKL